ncbi:MAG: sugar nucleotide-binding protein [Lachnospiraceae bacterium]|nr:sugar nucleotide-binding protein [Lachnospiraceae bacterium]
MRILVIGSGGMLGHMTTLYLAEKGYDVCDISKTKKCREETVLLDVCDTRTFSQYLKQHYFDVVINCVALLVGASEANPQMAHAINEEFPHWLENFFEGTPTQIIQVSTAGVFQGSNAPYPETADCDARGCYNITKYRGELHNSKDLTVRSDFWGPDMCEEASGLFHWIMTAEGVVNGFSNVVINGVSSLEFVCFIEEILGTSMTGIYHLHSEEPISKADLLRKICATFERTNIRVLGVTEPRRNTCLKTVTTHTTYHPKGYEQQMTELKEWMEKHRELYSHYFIQK